MRLFNAADAQWGLEWSSYEGDLGIGQFALELVDEMTAFIDAKHRQETRPRYRQYSGHGRFSLLFAAELCVWVCVCFVLFFAFTHSLTHFLSLSPILFVFM
jgi:hypothetical protein